MRIWLLIAVVLPTAVGAEDAPSWAEVVVEPPPAAVSVDAGERLYGWNCMPCHGAEGRGDGPTAQRLGLRPRDLTRGLFKLKSSVPGEMPFDDDLYRTITVGLPVSGMPGFAHALDPEHRWAVVGYIKTLFRPDVPARTRVVAPPDPGDPVRGEALFESCKACHGERPTADLRDAEGRPARIPDLARGPVEFLGGAKASDVFRVLTTGMEGSAMPSFASLPEADRRDLAAFVAARYRPVPAGERLYFAKGCVACHTMGKGRHLGPDLQGVGGRRSRDWLSRWLQDPEAMIRSDDDARRLFEEYRIAMPAPELTPDERAAIVDFLAGR